MYIKASAFTRNSQQHHHDALSLYSCGTPFLLSHLFCAGVVCRDAACAGVLRSWLVASDSCANGASIDALFSYNQLRNNREIAPENNTGRRRESWTKYMEKARYLEVAKKVKGTLERDRSNTRCSGLTSVQSLHKRAAPP